MIELTKKLKMRSKMKMYVVSLILLLNTSFGITTELKQDIEDNTENSYFKKPDFIPAGNYSEERGYEVYVRLKYDKMLDDTKPLFSWPPSQPLIIKELQDELNDDIQKCLGSPPSYEKGIKYPVTPEEFYHDLFKIGAYFLYLSGEKENLFASDIRKISRKWLYRAAIHNHMYAWYGLGLIWLMDKAEEGWGSANYYLSVLADYSPNLSEEITKNKESYTQKAIERRHPNALVEASHQQEDAKEYQKTLDLLMDAHQQGSLRAKTRLGRIYYYGLGEKALYARLLSGESLPGMGHLSLNQENDTIYLYDGTSNIKQDISDTYKNAVGIVPDKDLSHKFLKEAADKGYKPAILEIRNLFYDLDYPDPLEKNDVIAPKKNFKGTFIDFLKTYHPEMGTDYRIIESRTENYPYGSIYRESTQNWMISLSKMNFDLHKAQEDILRKQQQLYDISENVEKKIFEETVLPQLSNVKVQFPQSLND
jgi:TPR repeat protein